MAWWNPVRATFTKYHGAAQSLRGSQGTKVKTTFLPGHKTRRPDSLAFLRVGDTEFYLHQADSVYVGNKNGCALRIHEDHLAREHLLIQHASGAAASERMGLGEGAVVFTIDAMSFDRPIKIKSKSQDETIELNAADNAYVLQDGDSILLETGKLDPATGVSESIKLTFVTIKSRVNGGEPQALTAHRPVGLLPAPLEVRERQLLMDLQGGRWKRRAALQDCLDQNTAAAWKILAKDAQFMRDLLEPKNKERLLRLMELAHEGDQELVGAVRRLAADFELGYLDVLQQQGMLIPLLQLLETSVVLSMLEREFEVLDLVESAREAVLRVVIDRAKRGNRDALHALMDRWQSLPNQVVNRLHDFGILPSLIEVIPLNWISRIFTVIRQNIGEMQSEAEQAIGNSIMRRLRATIQSAQGGDEQARTFLQQHVTGLLPQALQLLNPEEISFLVTILNTIDLHRLEQVVVSPDQVQVLRTRFVELAWQGDREAQDILVGCLPSWEPSHTLRVDNYSGLLIRIVSRMDCNVSLSRYANNLLDAMSQEAMIVGQKSNYVGPLDAVLSRMSSHIEVDSYTARHLEGVLNRLCMGRDCQSYYEHLQSDGKWEQLSERVSAGLARLRR